MLTYLDMHAYICVYMCVHVCLCVLERERECVCGWVDVNICLSLFLPAL